jgi:RNA polymerase subunit RPABC4/transcription elongation factor Spt4
MVGSLSCKACGAYVAPNSKACPSCGKKRRSVKRILALVVGVEFAALAAGVYWWKMPRPHAPELQTLAAADATISDMTYRGGWMFYTTHDGAVNDLTKHARLISNPGTSENSADSKATLELRDSATYGKVVLISFPAVASACRTNRCAMTAVFDKNDAQPYDITLNEDTDTTTVEVPQFDSFVGHLQQAHDLALTIALGTAKDIVLRFTVAGFGWAENNVPVRTAASHV